jgi:hypothetical protein
MPALAHLIMVRDAEGGNRIPNQLAQLFRGENCSSFLDHDRAEDLRRAITHGRELQLTLPQFL